MKHFAYIAVFFAGCTTTRAGEDATLPLPPDYTKAESLIAEVESSTTLPADVKKELQQQYSNIKAQFDEAWTPLQASVRQFSAKKEYWEQTLAERDKETQQRNAITPTFTLPDQAGAKQAYDNQVKEWNTETSSMVEQGKNELESLRQECDDKAQHVAALSHAFHDFIDAAHAKLNFHKGPAFRQAEEASKGETNANKVMDGSNPSSRPVSGFEKGTGSPLFQPSGQGKVNISPEMRSNQKVQMLNNRNTQLQSDLDQLFRQRNDIVRNPGAHPDASAELTSIVKKIGKTQGALIETQYLQRAAGGN